MTTRHHITSPIVSFRALNNAKESNLTVLGPPLAVVAVLGRTAGVVAVLGRTPGVVALERTLGKEDFELWGLLVPPLVCGV